MIPSELDLHRLPSEVVAITSALRVNRRALPQRAAVVSSNAAPKPGDLVLVRCLSDVGAYTAVEDASGEDRRVSEGSLFIGVLGTRFSGTNVSGIVPDERLDKGSVLHLVAQGGLIARETGVSALYPARAMPVRVEGFLASRGRVLNTHDYPAIPANGNGATRSARILFVAGTSAEVGKTTCVCSIRSAVKQLRPDVKICAVKACGTGRMRDKSAYVKAGYDLAVDFVDFGFPSTYATPTDEYRALLTGMLGYCATQGDMTVVEIGGDFLEACAPTALEVMREMGAQIVVVVNDAMGGLEALRQLRALGTEPIGIGSYRQNLETLRMRLEVPGERMFLPSDAATLRPILGPLVN